MPCNPVLVLSVDSLLLDFCANKTVNGLSVYYYRVKK